MIQWLLYELILAGRREIVVVIDDKLMAEVALESLPRETLIKLIDMLYRNYSAVDGRWFQAVEDEFGLDTAVRLDEKVWEKHSMVEARRIKETFNITEQGLPAVFKALNFGMFRFLTYAPLECEETGSQKVTVSFTRCPLQELRIEKGRGEFSCKTVSLFILQNTARVIDPSVKVRCLLCPPDHHPADLWCKWEFSI